MQSDGAARYRPDREPADLVASTPSMASTAPGDAGDVAEWFARGRALLEQLEAQARSHEELADGYRSQASRLRAVLAGRVCPGEDGG